MIYYFQFTSYNTAYIGSITPKLKKEKTNAKKGGELDMTEYKLNYFEYLALAEYEFNKLVEKHPELTNLSKRELEVFSHLLTDKTQVQIAEDLFISYSSVHFHCKNIYRKLNINSRNQLLVKYKDVS